MLDRLRKLLGISATPAGDPAAWDVSQLQELAFRFRRVLADAKREAAPPDFPWYPYDSLANWVHLDRLLTGENRKLLALAGGAPILDIGPADGATSYFLESLGCEVCVAENPVTHHNLMQGFWKLHAALKSGIPAYTVDMDRDWRLPREDFGMALFLGVLYHLKNPFGAMERLAGHARHCVLSTRVTSHPEPVAWLVGPGDACGDDPTNYWLFSESGLKRLCERAGWSILDFTVVPSADPADIRAFCLLRSTVLPDWLAVSGFHSREPGGWRWTEREFTAGLPRPNSLPARFRLEFYIHPSILELPGPLTLTAACAGREIARGVFTEAGAQALEGVIHQAPAGATVRIDFALDRAIEPHGLDARQLGLMTHTLTWV